MSTCRIIRIITTVITEVRAINRKGIRNPRTAQPPPASAPAPIAVVAITTHPAAPQAPPPVLAEAPKCVL